MRGKNISTYVTINSRKTEIETLVRHVVVLSKLVFETSFQLLQNKCFCFNMHDEVKSFFNSPILNPIIRTKPNNFIKVYNPPIQLSFTHSKWNMGEILQFLA